MKIVLDRATCCGNLECVRIAPALFAETQAGLGTVIVEFPPSEQHVAARLAGESCPAGAIFLDDDSSAAGASRHILQGDDRG